MARCGASSTSSWAAATPSRPAAIAVITTLDWRAQRLAEKWLTRRGHRAEPAVEDIGASCSGRWRSRRAIAAGSRRCAARTSTTGRSSRSTTGPATCAPTPAAPATTAMRWRSRKFEPKYDAAGDGTRQPGSALKPIVYATAFERKELTPGACSSTSPRCFAVELGAARRRQPGPRTGPRPQGAPVLAQHPGHPGARAGGQRGGRQAGRGDGHPLPGRHGVVPAGRPCGRDRHRRGQAPRSHLGVRRVRQRRRPRCRRG